LFNQHQCFIYSTASFFVEIEKRRRYKNCVTRHKTDSTNDGLPEISKMKYRNRIPEPGTTISGFADNNNKKN
jgi:hypothetical protein